MGIEQSILGIPLVPDHSEQKRLLLGHKEARSLYNKAMHRAKKHFKAVDEETAHRMMYEGGEGITPYLPGAAKCPDTVDRIKRGRMPVNKAVLNAREFAGAMKSVEGDWSALIEATDGKDSSPERVDVRWVYHNLLTPLERIDLETIPSRGAVSLLQESRLNKAWFFRELWSKLMPSKAEIDRGSDVELDVRSASVLEDEFLSTMGEPPVHGVVGSVAGGLETL